MYEVGKGIGQTSCHLPCTPTSTFPLNLSITNALTFPVTPNPASSANCTLSFNPNLCVRRWYNTSSNSAFGNKFVEASRYPASRAPWRRDCGVQPEEGTWRRAEERIAVSVGG